jgi:serine/threonine-protein kinase
MRDELPRPTGVDPALPSLVDDWFAKACARNPQDRFANVREMIEAFACCFGELPAGVMSVPRVVSVPPKARADINPLASSVSPNATTLHDTSRSGIATSPGQNASRPAPSWSRLLGAGAAVFVVGAALAVAFIKLTGSGATGPQGLAASAGNSALVLAASESVPLAVASQSPASPPAEASAPVASASSTSLAASTSAPPTRLPPRATSTSVAAATAAPPTATATATAKKPPVVRPGNDDDIK